MDRRSFFRGISAGIAGITAAALPKEATDSETMACNCANNEAIKVTAWSIKFDGGDVQHTSKQKSRD